MKPTDLMLNDWVLWNNRYVQIVRTCAYACYNGHREVWLAHRNDDNFIEWHDISTIYPIPLTREILEKNGFWVMEKVDNGAEEYIAYATDGLIFHYNRDNDYYFPNTPISWKYVHELQHALRLCGLDELADNFKI